MPRCRCLAAAFVEPKFTEAAKPRRARSTANTLLFAQTFTLSSHRQDHASSDAAVCRDIDRGQCCRQGARQSRSFVKKKAFGRDKSTEEIAPAGLDLEPRPVSRPHQKYSGSHRHLSDRLWRRVAFLYAHEASPSSLRIPVQTLLKRSSRRT